MMLNLANSNPVFLRQAANASHAFNTHKSNWIRLILLQTLNSLLHTNILNNKFMVQKKLAPASG